MPAATNQSELLTTTQKEFTKLDRLLNDLPPEIVLTKGEDDTSIKDIIGHRAHWIDLFFHWHAEGAAGRTPEIPAPGYKWNQLKAYNANLREQQAQLTWADACQSLRDGHARLLAFIQEADDQSLYGAPMPGGGNAWTTGRWAEAAGAAHYRSAAKAIRQMRRALASG